MTFTDHCSWGKRLDIVLSWIWWHVFENETMMLRWYWEIKMFLLGQIHKLSS